MNKCLALIIICLIVILVCICSASGAEPSKEIKKLDKELTVYRYESKQTVIVGTVNKTSLENKVDLKHVEATKSGNCVMASVVTTKIAKKEGLKAEYKLEPNHVVVVITDKNGAKYRYSNFKNTGRCW